MLVRLLVRLIAQVERADLYEELLIHLELARDEWMMKGKTIDESEDLAIKSFGDSRLFGSQIQQAMFPYRKELLLTLSTASILFLISYYLGQLFGSGQTSKNTLSLHSK